MHNRPRSLRWVLPVALSSLCIVVGISAKEPVSIPLNVTVDYGGSATAIDQQIANLLGPPLGRISGVQRVEAVSQDGRYTAVLRLTPNSNADEVKQSVHDTLTKLLPQLPPDLPVIIARGDPDSLPLFWVALTSEEHDARTLGAIARRSVYDRLTRVMGVTEVADIGAAEDVLSVRLDPRRLAATDTTAGEVKLAITDAMKTAGPKAGEMPPNNLEQIIIRVIDGAVIRLRDVSRIELTTQNDRIAQVNGKPAVLLSVRSTGANPTAADLERTLAEIRPMLPEGVRLQVILDSNNHGCLIEGRIPSRTSDEEVRRLMARATDLVRTAAGPDASTVGYSMPGYPTFQLIASAKQGRLEPQMLRKSLAELPGVQFRVGEIGGKENPAPFPVQMGLTGTDPVVLAKWSDAVRRRMETEAVLVDLQAFPGADVEQKVVSIDRERAAALGLAVEDITEAIPLALGESWSVSQRGQRNLQIRMEAEQPMAKVQIRAASGKPVAIEGVLKVSTGLEPPAFFRLGGERAMRLSASPAVGRTTSVAAAACMAAAAEEAKTLQLGPEYRAINLTTVRE